MRLFRTKPIHCPAGTWTRIISHFGRGYRQKLTVRIRPLEGDRVEGEYAERRYFWIFREIPQRGPLEAEMTFTRRWINGIYQVDIRPTVDCEAEVR